MDFTFNNELIKNYFEGSDEYVPTGELMWLHTHPLVTPNFLTQIEELILKAGEIMQKHNMKGYPIPELEAIAIEIGQNLPDITIDNAPIILGAMRKAYKLSKDLTEKLG